MKLDSKLKQTSQGLFKDRENLEKNVVSRGAAVFPIFDLKSTDLILIFQNYWKWKRALDVEYKITLRNVEGKELLNTKKKKVEDINIISIKEVVEKNFSSFELFKFGLVEIEILSKKNIVYPFPAIIGSYKSKNGMISSVHSCGRTLEKGTIENQNFSETNFYVCKSDRFIPFIHIFNGYSGSIRNIKIIIRKASSNSIYKTISIEPLEKQYESKVIFFNVEGEREINLDKKSHNFKNQIDLPDSANYLVSIEGSCSSIFPRFLCGNFDKKNNHYCVTHTFREVNFEGDTLENCLKPDNQSYVSLPTLDKSINLKAVVYPTSSPTSLKVKLNQKDFKNLSLNTKSTSRDLSAKACEIYTANISSEESDGIVLTALPDNEGKILPARIGINLMYSLNSGMQTMPPDIAHQMSTYLTGHKLNYWYAGLIENGYENVILGSSIISTSLINGKAESIDFDLCVELSEGKNFVKNYRFNSVNGKSFQIKLDKVITEFGIDLNNSNAYAWRIKVNKGKMGALYCLSYNSELGCIYGEHSF